MIDPRFLPRPKAFDIDSFKGPRRLYHYTDARGFYGIVTGGVRLHATHFRFVNDLGEIDFGLRAFRRAIDVKRKELGDGVCEALKERIQQLGDRNIFLACLSTRHDVLSQWRAYADNCSGYCLGVRPHADVLGPGYYDEEGLESGDSTNRLVECKYGEDEATSLFTEGLEDVLRLPQVEESGDVRDGWLLGEVEEIAEQLIPRAKHAHFSEELEWRLVADAPESAVQYRVGAKGMTPFVSTHKLSLEQVWVGPRARPSPGVAARAAETFLAQNDIEAKVECWASPFGG